MSAEIGGLGSYALAVQQMQMSLIKTNIDMQKQAIDILLDDNASPTVPVSDSVGCNVDVSI